MYDTPQTLIAKALAERERPQAWLARKLQVTRQSVGEWVRGEIACPRARQAQIALILNEDDPRGGAYWLPSYLFDRHGFALRED